MDADGGNGPVATVGEWAEEKVTLLRRYIEVSAETRRKYVDESEATYIDLYSGPGLVQIRGAETPVFGSPLAAWDAATSSGVRFNRYFVADLDGKLCAAARDRLLRRNASAIAVAGPAEDTVGDILRQINQYGLHLALLDPYNLDDLPFSIIERLAGLKRIDLMINLCTGDLQRNLRETYLRDDNNTLRRFAPRWNPPASPGLSERQIREHFVQYWFTLLQGLGFGAHARMHRVRNSTQSTMYWFVFVSRHPIARKFWGTATQYLAQQSLL